MLPASDFAAAIDIRPEAAEERSVSQSAALSRLRLARIEALNHAIHLDDELFAQDLRALSARAEKLAQRLLK